MAKYTVYPIIPTGLIPKLPSYHLQEIGSGRHQHQKECESEINIVINS